MPCCSGCVNVCWGCARAGVCRRVRVRVCAGVKGGMRTHLAPTKFSASLPVTFFFEFWNFCFSSGDLLS
jgi:hypothetical protein